MRGLVVGGGGFIGISYFGAVKQLHKFGYLNTCNYFAGSSIGSLVCACYLVLIKEPNIEETFKHIMLELLSNYTENDISLKSFFINWGICKRESLKQDLLNFVFKYTNIYNPTFKQFYEFNKKTFFVTVSNISKHKLEYFSHTNVPDIYVIDAILASTCIPFICERVVINDCYYCDGCIYDKTPIYPLLEFVKDTEIIVIQNSSEKQQIYTISCIKEYFIHIFHLCSIKQKHKTVLNAINVNNSKVPVFTLDFDLISSHIDYSYKLGENAVLSWNEKYLKKLL